MKIVANSVVSETQKLAYSVPEAAAATSLSQPYLWQLIYSGKLRSMKVGKRRLIPAHALRGLVQ